MTLDNRELLRPRSQRNAIALSAHAAVLSLADIRIAGTFAEPPRVQFRMACVRGGRMSRALARWFDALVSRPPRPASNDP